MAALNLVTYLLKLVLCGMAFLAGVGVSGGVLPRLGLKAPPMPEGADAKTVGAYTAAGSLFVALALAQLAAGMAGGLLERWLALTALAWLAWGVNTVLEVSLFTVYEQGARGAPFTLLYSLAASLTLALAVAWLFPGPGPGVGFWASVVGFFSRHTFGEWAWRLVGALAAFPAIYYLFGALISPIVLDYYRRNSFGLTLPKTSGILRMQAVRSLLFLLAVLPVLVLWHAARSVFPALGVALFILVGWTPVFVAYWLPKPLRLTHGLEILVDSLACAWVVAKLLGPH
ncbi:MAG: hypothetical protein ACM3XZ_05435 [Betaproteobacteria bacterium]